MSLSYINGKLKSFKTAEHKVESYFFGGLSAASSFVPENIIAWIGSDAESCTKAHLHHRVILKIILNGSVRTCIDGISVRMKKGEAILYFPHQLHSTTIEGDSSFRYMAITFTEKNQDYSMLFPLKNKVMKISLHDEKLLFGVFDSFNRRKSVFPEHAVFSLSEFISRHIRAVQSEEKIPEHPVCGEDPFGRICDYIRRNFDRRISLKTMADQLKMNPQQIRRLFIRNYGRVTPGNMLRNLRIQYAVERLLRSDDAISTISVKCGFRDQFVFSRAFKNVTGMSPTDYRKKMAP